MEDKILHVETKEAPNEAAILEVVRSILRKEVGTKEQRNAIIRIYKQIEPLVINRDMRAAIKKAINRIAIDNRLVDIS